jgi:hypothetical protein
MCTMYKNEMGNTVILSFVYGIGFPEERGDFFMMFSYDYQL